MKLAINTTFIDFKFYEDDPIEKPKRLDISGVWTEEGFVDMTIFHEAADFTNEFEAAGVYQRIKEIADESFRSWLKDQARDSEEEDRRERSRDEPAIA